MQKMQLEHGADTRFDSGAQMIYDYPDHVAWSVFDLGARMLRTHFSVEAHTSETDQRFEERKRKRRRERRKERKTKTAHAPD